MRDSIEKIITNNKYLISQNNNNEMIITLKVAIVWKKYKCWYSFKNKKIRTKWFTFKIMSINWKIKWWDKRN